MKILLTIGLLFCHVRADENKFCSDEWFTNKVEVKDFLKFLSKFDNSMTDSHKMRFYGAFTYFGLNPIMALAKMQTESSGVCQKLTDYQMNRLMGYGIMSAGNCTFDVQTWGAAKLLHDAFNGFRPNAGMVLEAQRHPWDKRVRYYRPLNASTYALTVYTPVYAPMSEFDKHGKEYPCGGNSLFEIVNSNFMAIYRGME